MKLEKITHRLPGGRSYGDACGAAHALDLVGERWALLVIRELMLGPKRFSDLRADLPGISANVLTQRLEGLEAAGVLQRRRLPPPAAAQVYELTPWGYEAEAIFIVLGRWATRSPLHDPTLPLSSVSLMLSFRTMFDPSRAGGRAALLAFRLGDEEFRVEIAQGGLTVARAAVARADCTVIGQAPAVAACVYGGVPVSTMLASGALAITGDSGLFEAFCDWFPLPAKVGD